MTAIAFPQDIARVAFAGDWHGDSAFAVTAVHAAADRGADVVVHTGDFGWHFTLAFLGSLEAAAAKRDLIIMFVDGNHEDFDWLHAQPIDPDGVRRLTPRIWHLPRGMRWTWAGLTFMALGGAHSVDRQWRTAGRDWWHQEVLTETDIHRAIAGGPVDVMITHDTPAGHFIPGLMPDGTFPAQEITAADAHRSQLRRVVDAVQPRFLWHGHYHSRYTTQTDYGLFVTGLDCGREGRAAIKHNLDIVDLFESSTIEAKSQ